MRALAFLGAFVLLALAVCAALLAADVNAWQNTLRTDDAALTAAPANTHVPFRLAERLLGVRDDVAARRALALYRQAAHTSISRDNAFQGGAALAQAESALADIARGSNRARASQAETLLGVLVFTDVGPSADPFQETTGTDPDQAQASLTDFEDAVRADPQNATAKYDLELALRILLAQGIRVGAGQQTGAGSTGQRGAGGGVAGGGY